MDEITEKWHALADQPLEAIALRYSEESTNLIGEVLRRGLGETESIQFESASTFADYVVDLRKNEQAWSRRLGDTILQSQELFDSGDSTEAIAMLAKFVSICPWHHFAEIADVQRQNLMP
jgi:hypothetical protein